jgi:hypothetical protein
MFCNHTLINVDNKTNRYLEFFKYILSNIENRPRILLPAALLLLVVIQKTP